MNKEKEEMKEEIRKEFQLERMILFSDAVFAIAITLMAIEIRIPSISGDITKEMMTDEMLKLIPSVITYAVSFFFIGHIWYQHLKVFAVLKDYDLGLIVRNLIMLFFVGLFPFSTSIMFGNSSGLFLPLAVYFSILIACKISQLVLNHYILFKRKNLRINCNINNEIRSFKKSRLAIGMLVLMFVIVILSQILIEDKILKQYTWCLFILFPILLKYYDSRLK